MVYILAIASAISFSLAAIFQKRQVRSISTDANLRVALLWQLIKNPYWILGVLFDIFAFVGQFLALKEGSILVVSPILAFGLSITIFADALFERKRPSGSMVVLTLVAGLLLAIFLSTTATNASKYVPNFKLGVVISLTVTVIFVTARFAPFRGSKWWIDFILPVFTGVTHGIAIFVTKATTSLVTTSGFGALFTHWPGYVLVLIGAIDLIMTQSVLQLVELSGVLPVVNLLEPTVAMTLGVFFLKDHITSSLGNFAIAFILVGLGGVTFAISVLSSRLVTEGVGGSEGN
ncbi:MAG: DMT family transporter [Actinomycetota bacterium]|nr:DMT family transporter [Actinomycetota bacterium]